MTGRTVRTVRTVRTFIYAILAVEAAQIKIGCSVHPRSRLLDFQIGNGSELRMLATARGTIHEEQLLHRRLKQSHLRREWFSATPEVLAIVEELRAKNDPWTQEKYEYGDGFTYGNNGFPVARKRVTHIPAAAVTQRLREK